MSDKLIDTADSDIHDLRLALRKGNKVLQNRLDHKVAKLIIDQDFNAFKRNTNQVFLPLALRSRDTIFDNLAPMLVSGNMSEMLNDRIVND